MDRGQLARAVGWVAGVPAAIAAAVFLVLLVVNWNDEPPSADAQRLTAMKAGRAHVEDAANGYVHALGLTAPRDADPIALGRERRAYIEGFTVPPGSTGTGVLPGRDEDYRSARSPAVQSLADGCSEADTCLDALRTDPDALDAWLASEQWLLDRYDRMLATGGWREAIPGHANAPLPAWQPALDAQKLHLLVAHAKAVEGDADAVRDLLERDHAFWRRTLASSETILSKMIAVAAVRRNLALGNLSLRELPPDLAHAALPPSWREPVTVAERSMARALAGEWIFMSNAMRTDLSPEAMAAHTDGPRHNLLTRRLVFKMQATINLSAARMVRLGEVSELPYPELTAELDRLAEPVEPRRGFRLYNAVGHVLDGIAAPAYLDYIARAADLEGLRLATTLVADLRAAGTPGDAVADAIHGLPTDGAAANGTLEWDADSVAVVFHGLASGDRGRFAVPF